MNAWQSTYLDRDEQRIELAAERKYDALDARFMRAEMTQEQYDSESLRIAQWCDDQYRKLDMERTRQ